MKSLTGGINASHVIVLNTCLLTHPHPSQEGSYWNTSTILFPVFSSFISLTLLQTLKQSYDHIFNSQSLILSNVRTVVLSYHYTSAKASVYKAYRRTVTPPYRHTVTPPYRHTAISINTLQKIGFNRLTRFTANW
jgi:hypothetical protein